MRAYRPYRLKELKSHYRLDDLPTRKAHIVETLLLGAVITLLVSRRLLQAVRERLRRTPYKMPEQHWGAIFAAAAPAMLDIVLLRERNSLRLIPFWNCTGLRAMEFSFSISELHGDILY